MPIWTSICPDSYYPRFFGTQIGKVVGKVEDGVPNLEKMVGYVLLSRVDMLSLHQVLAFGSDDWGQCRVPELQVGVKLLGFLFSKKKGIFMEVH